MKKLKHSKYKNTGILFELLVRKLTSETMTSDKSMSLVTTMPILPSMSSITTDPTRILPPNDLPPTSELFR